MGKTKKRARAPKSGSAKKKKKVAVTKPLVRRAAPKKKRATSNKQKTSGPKSKANARTRTHKKHSKRRRPNLTERIRRGFTSPQYAIAIDLVREKSKVRELQAELEAKQLQLEQAQVQYDREERDAIAIEGKDALYQAIRWLHQDASPALYPSILRHMTEAQEWRLKLHKVGHSDPNDPAFQKLARTIAREVGVSVREVYTLWWSP